jgi:hypothetical protein
MNILDEFAKKIEYIVIIDKRNNLILECNGHSINLINSDIPFLKFKSIQEAEKGIEDVCDAEELNIDNYKVGRIIVGYYIVKE